MTNPTQLPDSAITIELGWPPEALSPNARCHYMALSRAKRKYRQACYIDTLAALNRRTLSNSDNPAVRYAVKIEFHPPSRRRFDLDNLVARMKAGLDGMADALGVNDHRFAITPRIGEVRRFDGGVVVRISEIERT